MTMTAAPIRAPHVSENNTTHEEGAKTLNSNTIITLLQSNVQRTEDAVRKAEEEAKDAKKRLEDKIREVGKLDEKMRSHIWAKNG